MKHLEIVALLIWLIFVFSSCMEAPLTIMTLLFMRN